MIMKSIKVSIVTVCYNSEKTIRKTIESVLRQTYKNIEYILVDGKSQDHTVDIIKEYLPAFHGRMRYVSERDKGIYHAINKGLRMSSGKIIGIINSDDYYEEDTVQKIVGRITGTPYQVIYGYCNMVKENSVIVLKSSHKQLEEFSMIPHPACFVTRKTYSKYGMFIEKFKVVSDYELMLRFYKSEEVLFTQIPEILANFRAGGISSCKETIGRIEMENAIVYYRYQLISFRELIETLLLNMFSIKYKKTRSLSNNHLSLFLLLDHWVAIKQEGKSISDFLERQGYCNIAIYGMSYVGKRLIEELEGSNIHVSYGIDRREWMRYKDIDIVSVDCKLEKVDAVIVTAVYYFHDIEPVLKRKLDCPVISLEEALYRVESDMEWKSEDAC